MPALERSAESWSLLIVQPPIFPALAYKLPIFVTPKFAPAAKAQPVVSSEVPILAFSVEPVDTRTESSVPPG